MAEAVGRRCEVMVVLPVLMPAMVLAMPRIVGESGGLTHLSWVVTAYVLGTTVSTPIWGKIGDLYGRKTIFIISVVIFMIGSALCGMAGSFIKEIPLRGGAPAQAAQQEAVSPAAG
ncbi:MFS transporter [Nonomuraea sp. NPDC052265]|uniref:MFS transporter n=1 Tax=Nonomuraea sp. NPDC052265 TaxID=3364374 RepID=UPI0037CCBCE2